MRPDALGRWEAGGHQHGRPVDGVKTRDVFPDDMQVRRPPRLELRRVASIADAGDVVGEGVAPHIDDVPVVSREWDAPTDRRARDAEITESTPNDAEDFVAPTLGLDELRMFLEMLQEAILVAGEREEIVLLLQVGRLQRGVDQAESVPQVRVLFEFLAGCAVPAFVGALVDVVVLLDPFDEILNALDMVRVFSTDEAVVRNLEARLDLAIDLRHPITEILSGQALLPGPPLHVERVFIATGEKEGLVTDHPVVPSEHVRPCQLINEAQVRRVVDIDDCGGDVELTHLRLSNRCRQPRPSARLGVETSQSAPGVSPVFHVRILRGPW